MGTSTGISAREGLRTQTTGGGRFSGSLGTEWVGRDAELAAVREASETVAGGIGRVVFITGEAGVGKSRLVAEARRAEAQRAMLLREGRAKRDRPAAAPRATALSSRSCVRTQGSTMAIQRARG